MKRGSVRTLATRTGSDAASTNAVREDGSSAPTRPTDPSPKPIPAASRSLPSDSRSSIAASIGIDGRGRELGRLSQERTEAAESDRDPAELGEGGLLTDARLEPGDGRFGLRSRLYRQGAPILVTEQDDCGAVKCSRSRPLGVRTYIVFRIPVLPCLLPREQRPTSGTIDHGTEDAGVGCTACRDESHFTDRWPRDAAAGGLRLPRPGDVCTSLTVILGSAGLLQEFHRALGPEDIELLASGIMEAALRLNRAAGRLARPKRRAPSSPPGRSVPCGSGSSGAADVRSAAREAAFRAGRLADLRLDLHDVPVTVPSILLRKVVSEIVRNAFDLSERGASVRVLLRADGLGSRLEIAGGETRRTGERGRRPLAAARRIAKATGGVLGGRPPGRRGDHRSREVARGGPT